uniref:Protein kinase domain-containing protein n=1 Tax=Sander lucioperca TaxID=283035 RepID=A0A8C9Z9G1_SANLU
HHGPLYGPQTQGEIIGQGAYGTVYKATCQKTGKEFALKCHKRSVEEATVRELSCLMALQGHPYVIQIHECDSRPIQIGI